MDHFPVSERWRQWRRQTDLDEYEARWERLESLGEKVHGEADFVDRYAVARVLDAGCGMGRVGRELARRGYEVVGVDNDPDMLERARANGTEATWVLGDLTSVRFNRPFDTIVLAGDVLLFVEPSRRHLVVPNLVEALVEGGWLICGTSFSPSYDLRGYDEWCHHAGLDLIERYGTWERDSYRDDRNYAVSVHRRKPPSEPAS